jgi:antitoxin MazE
MYFVKTAIRRLGNSQGVTIPRSILDEAGLAIDSPIEMTVDGSLIVIRKIESHPRERWAVTPHRLRTSRKTESGSKPISTGSRAACSCGNLSGRDVPEVAMALGGY